jgi:hypothetical protein
MKTFISRSEMLEISAIVEKKLSDEARRKKLDAFFPFQRDWEGERKALEMILLGRLMSQALMIKMPNLANHFRKAIASGIRVTSQYLDAWIPFMAQAVRLEKQRQNQRDEQELVMRLALAEVAQNPNGFRILRSPGGKGEKDSGRGCIASGVCPTPARAPL